MALHALSQLLRSIRSKTKLSGSYHQLYTAYTEDSPSSLEEAVAVTCALAAILQISVETTFHLPTHREGELSGEDLVLTGIPLAGAVLEMTGAGRVVFASRAQGEFALSIKPGGNFARTLEAARQRVQSIALFARCQGVPGSVAERMLSAAEEELRGFGVPIAQHYIQEGEGSEPLVSFTVQITGGAQPFSFTSHGRVKLPAEDVARKATQRVRRFLRSEAAIPVEYLPLLMTALLVKKYSGASLCSRYTVDALPATIRGLIGQLLGSDDDAIKVEGYGSKSSLLVFD